MKFFLLKTLVLSFFLVFVLSCNKDTGSLVPEKVNQEKLLNNKVKTPISTLYLNTTENPLNVCSNSIALKVKEYKIPRGKEYKGIKSITVVPICSYLVGIEAELESSSEVASWYNDRIAENHRSIRSVGSLETRPSVLYFALEAVLSITTSNKSGKLMTKGHDITLGYGPAENGKNTWWIGGNEFKRTRLHKFPVDLPAHACHKFGYNFCGKCYYYSLSTDKLNFTPMDVNEENGFYLSGYLE